MRVTGASIADAMQGGCVVADFTIGQRVRMEFTVYQTGHWRSVDRRRGAGQAHPVASVGLVGPRQRKESGHEVR